MFIAYTLLNFRVHFQRQKVKTHIIFHTVHTFFTLTPKCFQHNGNFN